MHNKPLHHRIVINYTAKTKDFFSIYDEGFTYFKLLNWLESDSDALNEIKKRADEYSFPLHKVTKETRYLNLDVPKELYPYSELEVIYEI